MNCSKEPIRGPLLQDVSVAAELGFENECVVLLKVEPKGESWG